MENVERTRMSRKDWIWVIIKAFGIYFGVETVLSLPAFLMIFSSRVNTGDTLTLVFPRFILQGILSLYLLKGGRWIFLLIGPSAPPSDTAS
jgi:hypothetical protein